MPLTCLLWHCSLSLHCLASSSHTLMFCGSAHPIQAPRLILNLTCGWGPLKALLENQRPLTSSLCTALFCSSISSVHSLLRGPRLIIFLTGHNCGEHWHDLPGCPFRPLGFFEVLGNVSEAWGGCVISGRKESKLYILSAFANSPTYLTERTWHRKNNAGDKCLSSCFLSYQNTKKADET